jgi:hypothetical protein
VATKISCLHSFDGKNNLSHLKLQDEIDKIREVERNCGGVQAKEIKAKADLAHCQVGKKYFL